MANYFSLPLELRQQILFEALAQADKDDLHSLPVFKQLRHSHILSRVQELCQIHLDQDPASEGFKLCTPLRYAPVAAQLIQNLLAADEGMKYDLKFVVNTW